MAPAPAGPCSCNSIGARLLPSLVFDVGNTTVTEVTFSTNDVGASVQATRTVSHAEDPDSPTLLDAGPSTAADLWVVGSVHSAGTRLLERLRSAGRSPCHGYFRGDRFPMKLGVRHGETVGVDRLAGCLAAFQMTRVANIVVDLGTAITVDWVDGDGSFQGGAIVPGLQLCADALRQGTDRLPRIEMDPAHAPCHLPGKDTSEAIRHGIDAGLPGLVDRLIEDLQASTGPCSMWVTGGDAAWFRQRSRHELVHDPVLVARGFLAAALEETS